MASSEEIAMRAAITVWGRPRWPGARIIHELVCGERRIDMVFVCQADLIGFEIKSSRDRLDRLADQIKEYGRYIPEVWAAVAPKWQDHDALHYCNRNLLVVGADVGVVDYVAVTRGRAHRDELVTARMLEWLWVDEANRIAHRTQVIPGPINKSSFRPGHVKKLLARLLTGNEIIREVCRELRARPLVGNGSDPPIAAEASP